MEFFNFSLNSRGDYESPQHDETNLAQSVLVYFNYEEVELDPFLTWRKTGAGNYRGKRGCLRWT